MHSALIEYYPLQKAWCETKFIEYRENKLIVAKYVQNVRHWYEHKHASLLAIGQLCHQTAQATHEKMVSLRHNDVIFTSQVK